ncbi:Dedicator of cytokinesis protein 1 [Cyphellophora attinorum]|uniref:Dedicator of cytokinesis protein 1 n=1 Tax=Cyphellophora attinorum TaxID=1664694 RepID=A0A0N1HEW1_9EURO|nr:Dedicator of cytokinesis protein 1 [Phialophora attinorum]KPI43666.1 Dedicator of cytokinesis protein 1 [Phialophora attinorum]
MPWRPLPLSYAVAVYPFQSPASPIELPLQIGDQLYVIEEGGINGEWCRGYLLAPLSLVAALTTEARSASDSRVYSGIFPRCCIEFRETLAGVVSHENGDAINGERPPAPVPMLKIGDESPTSTAEPLVDEISSCLREWCNLHLPDLILQQQYELLDEVAAITGRLDYARRQLLHDVLTIQERRAVREMAVWDLVRGNKMLNGEVIVRDAEQQGRLLTADDSAIELSKLQSVMGALNDPPIDKVEVTSLHHALVEAKSIGGTELDSVMLNFGVYELTEGGALQPFSEMYSAPASSKLKTLFADFNARDVAQDGRLFLVVKAVTPEPPRQGPKQMMEETPTRNGTLVSRKDSILNRRRSSLMFGSKRKPSSERPQVGSDGRIVREKSLSNPATPVIPEDNGQPRSPKPVGPPIPRTVAVAVTDIAHTIRAAGAENEPFDLKLWSPSQRSDEDISDFNPLVVPFFKRNSTIYGAGRESLITNNPTTMFGVCQSKKIGFSEAPSKTRSDIYLTLSRANIAQGAQLSHPEIGPTPIKPSSLLNMQLTMEVRDVTGRRVEQCIHVSSNSVGVTAFRTNAAELGSDWDQTVCLRIPAARVPECHLVLSIADAPEFPFALAWMPLWDKSAFIADGKRSLILHAYDKSTSSINRGRGAYLSLPWDYKNYAAGHDGVRAILASLEISTKLCSTEFSQDRVLVSLISWKHASSVQLMDLLQKLVFVPEIEIVKQLNDVLDALFAILVHKSGESKFEDLIFNDIVFVLGIVHDRRFNLGPLVEQYADNHFNSPFAASCLIRSFTRLLQSVSDPQSARDMRALFKVGKQFLKLLMASYQQRRNSRHNNDTDKKHATFKEDMQVILFGLQMMMRSETPALVGSKTLLTQNFHSWLPELLSAYNKDEVIKIAVGLVEAGDEAEGKLVLYRLLMILNYTKLDQIWVEPRDRAILVKQCLRWLKPHWTVNELTTDWKEQLRLCCSIVAELCRFPSSQLYEFLPSVISTYCYVASEPSIHSRTLTMLFPNTYPLPSRTAVTNEHFDEVLLELSALLATIGKMKAPSLPKSLRNGGVDQYISSTLSVVRSLLSNDAFPASWLSLHVYHHSAALNILRYLDGLLNTHFIPDPEQAENFDMELWKTYLETLLSLISSPALTLESFPEQKRRAVWKIAGDLRQSGADLLRRSWENLGWEATDDDLRRYNIRRLGGYQVQYVPGLVGAVLELCLSMHEGLRRVAVEMLQTMIVSEWALSEDLDLIETEFIGALNSLAKTRRLDAYEAMGRKLWVTELLNLFSTIANQPDDALWTALEELVSTVDELIDLIAVNEEDKHDSTGAAAAAGSVTSDNHTEVGSGGARKSMDGLSSSRGTREYGVNALESFKALAAEYERTGDYKRLARVHRSIARIHETRANGRAPSALGVNGHHHHHLEGVDDDDD